MHATELEKEPFELPVINPWRTAPTREQVRFAMDLCRSELRSPQDTIDGLRALSGREVSGLIDRLKGMRAQRLRTAPRDRHWRLAPLGTGTPRALPPCPESHRGRVAG